MGIVAELDQVPAATGVIALHPAVLARYEEQLNQLQTGLAKGIVGGDSESAEAMRDLVETVTVFRDPSRIGIKEVDDGIWLVSFMHYDLGYIDLEQRTLQAIDNPFGTRLSPIGLHPFGETVISNSSPCCGLRLVSFAVVA
ncbi:hypothetical protein GCM10010869_37580 [Mesorhizobium tianshanense]|uniref:Uncharacterized protein n=1 Tax=Mesorhizobium tianshanense TaxID=39844 RepID=A0A562P2X5_9HYPH|nr:hypothetical protein IQ26_02226 [Mesorhizobium tianshanense]GLS38164.1 hypothetical protein GCM10010869_37580 [Mesorhizobium tianshanense]